jgi:hypothetical protein
MPKLIVQLVAVLSDTLAAVSVEPVARVNPLHVAEVGDVPDPAKVRWPPWTLAAIITL